MINGQTKLLGVIGDPIAHSLSPVMQNAAIAQLGVDYVYLPFAVAPENLGAAIAGFAAIDLQGFNVTIPHKQAIMPFLTAVSPIAQAIGAVNTVWKTPQGWHGTNTDVIGFLKPLQAYSRDWANLTALILGNGGAARAVVAGCGQLGCGAIQVVGRDPEKLHTFAQSWQRSPLSPTLSVHSWAELPNLLPTAGLLVNTTPVGMHTQAALSPVPETLLDRLQPGTIVYDLIYNPRPTELLQQAAQRGTIVLDGLEMLVQQGAAALEIWLQQPAPIEVMRRALTEQLL